jgi:hypothetical protein
MDQLLLILAPLCLLCSSVLIACNLLVLLPFNMYYRSLAVYNVLFLIVILQSGIQLVGF